MQLLNSFDFLDEKRKKEWNWPYSRFEFPNIGSGFAVRFWKLFVKMWLRFVNQHICEEKRYSKNQDLGKDEKMVKMLDKTVSCGIVVAIKWSSQFAKVVQRLGKFRTSYKQQKVYKWKYKVMGKQSFVTMRRGKKSYKVYISQILRVHSLVRRERVPVPAYLPVSPVDSEKETNIEFQYFRLNEELDA